MHVSMASAPGSGHINPGQPGKHNNQDAVVVLSDDDTFVGVVCDGCSAEPHAEVGAKLGARILAKTVMQESKKKSPFSWSDVTNKTLASLEKIGRMLDSSDGGSYDAVVREFFLFTAVVVVVHRNECRIGLCGDGVVVLDGEVHVHESSIPNTPPYCGHALTSTQGPYAHLSETNPYALKEVHAFDIRTLTKGVIIGSDGLTDLLSDASLADDLYHPVLMDDRKLQRWLNVHTTERIDSGTFVPGKCRDDVSMIIMRTDEQQKMLLAERTVVANLKRQVDTLQSSLNSTVALSEVQESQLRRMTDELEALRHTTQLREQERRELLNRITKMRSKFKKPDTSALGELFKLFAAFLGVNEWPKEAPPANAHEHKFSHKGHGYKAVIRNGQIEFEKKE